LLVCRFRKQLPEFSLDVGLDVGTETLALVGRSGGGKSTALRVIAGLAAAGEGTVSLGERTLLDVAAGTNVAPESRRIGFLFQQYALFPHLTVAENVAFGLFGLTRSERHARVHRGLEFVDLRGRDRARPDELSGGERQRVALARAIVTEPDALLLDEPLAALDVENRARIRAELRALLKRLAVPCIVVSHDFDDARVLGDRIAAMDRGTIAQIGTAADLAARPANDFVAALTGTNVADAASNGSASRRVAFDPWAATLAVAPSGAPYEWRCTVVDLRPLGSQLRVILRGTAEFKVDVASAQAGQSQYKVGDQLFVSVPADAIRMIEDLP